MSDIYPPFVCGSLEACYRAIAELGGNSSPCVVLRRDNVGPAATNQWIATVVLDLVYPEKCRGTLTHLHGQSFLEPVEGEWIVLRGPVTRTARGKGRIPEEALHAAYLDALSKLERKPDS